jgi:hypothetical protein
MPIKIVKNSSVSDYDRVGSNERIGHVVIGNNASGVGLKHWQDMASSNAINVPHLQKH